MAELEPILAIARTVLIGRSPLVGRIRFCWSTPRASRPWRSPVAVREVKAWRLDRFALSVAALFHRRLPFAWKRNAARRPFTPPRR